MTNRNITMQGTTGKEVKGYLTALIAEIDENMEYDLTLQVVEHPEDP